MFAGGEPSWCCETARVLVSARCTISPDALQMLPAQALAKEGNTLLLPAAMNDPAGMVAQAMSIYGTVSKQQPFSSGGGGGGR